MLCKAKNALHQPTSDGYDKARKLWEEQHARTMALPKAVDICRVCHRLAPFCFYNGNTFAAIIRDAILALNLPAAEAHVVRSLAGHIVAGVASSEEVQAFERFCSSLQAGD
jgi:hypothetical protein